MNIERQRRRTAHLLAHIETFGAPRDVKGFLLACRHLQIHEITCRRSGDMVSTEHVSIDVTMKFSGAIGRIPATVR